MSIMSIAYASMHLLQITIVTSMHFPYPISNLYTPYI